MNRSLYLFILLMAFSNILLATESILGSWETTDQYGYGYMLIESEQKGKIIFQNSFWANGVIEVALSDFEKTDDGFTLKMELVEEESTLVGGTASYSDNMLCLKVSSPKEPNLMCFMRPDLVDSLRKNAINEHAKEQ